MNGGYSVRALAAARNRLIGGNLSKVPLILSTSGSRAERISAVIASSGTSFVRAVVGSPRGNIIKSKRHRNRREVSDKDRYVCQPSVPKQIQCTLIKPLRDMAGCH